MIGTATTYWPRLGAALAPAILALWSLAIASPAIAATHKPHVVFINPGETGEVFWSLVSGTMQAAADARGIPVLMLLNDIIGADRAKAGEPRQRLRHWLGAIVPDDRAAGRRMAAALVRFARTPDDRNTVRLLAIHGDTLTPASIERNGGLADVAAADPDVHIEAELVADWNENKAARPVERALARSERLGLEPGRNVGVAGLNWSHEGLAAVKDGALLTRDGGHFFPRAWAMVVLRDHFDAVTAIPPTVRLEMSAVTAANQAEFCATIGKITVQRSFEQIDFKRFTLGPGGATADYDFSVSALIAATRPVST